VSLSDGNNEQSAMVGGGGLSMNNLRRLLFSGTKLRTTMGDFVITLVTVEWSLSKFSVEPADRKLFNTLSAIVEITKMTNFGPQ